MVQSSDSGMTTRLTDYSSQGSGSDSFITTRSFAVTVPGIFTLTDIVNDSANAFECTPNPYVNPPCQSFPLTATFSMQSSGAWPSLELHDGTTVLPTTGNPFVSITFSETTSQSFFLNIGNYQLTDNWVDTWQTWGEPSELVSLETDLAADPLTEAAEPPFLGLLIAAWGFCIFYRHIAPEHCTSLLP